MAIYTFETTAEGWGPLSGSTVARSTNQARTGAGSLLVSKPVSGVDVYTASEAVSPTNPPLTGINMLAVWIKVADSSPAAAGNATEPPFSARLRVMNNVDWTFVYGAYTEIVKGNWSQVTMDISAIDKATAYRFDIQAFHNKAAAAGTFGYYVDDIGAAEAENVETPTGIARVDIRVDGGAWVAGTLNTSNGEWSIDLDTTSWAPGTHTIEARAVDGAGNISALQSRTVWHSPDGLYGAAPVPGQHLVPILRKGYVV